MHRFAYLYEVSENMQNVAVHLCDMQSGQTEGILMPSKEGLYTDTVTLKWCTPKSTTVGWY